MSNKARIIALLIASVLLFMACAITDKKWTVTQYGNPDGPQMTCYGIVNEKGEFILIDGGYDTDVPWVREIIRAYGDHVTAWIISHPHPDHAGAFNAIMKDNTEIQVDNIYTIEVNYDRYKETAQDYDHFEVYEEFLAITSEMDNVTYLKENDELEVAGLQMKVLHAWDKHTESLRINLLNNGSMMFVLTGEEDSILFCSDICKESENMIIESHKDDLDVDYIQLGHHGNWGMTTTFYDYTNPKAVFFDAPNWLMEESDSYDAWKLADYFTEREIEIYRFQTEANTIVLD